ncbi:hypothetical protein D3C87_1648610 [compost metagenome]
MCRLEKIKFENRRTQPGTFGAKAFGAIAADFLSEIKEKESEQGHTHGTDSNGFDFGSCSNK